MRFNTRDWPARLCAMSCALILSGCETMTGSGGISTGFTVMSKTGAEKGDRKPLIYCGAAEPFLWSVNDTGGTIAQAKAHNAKWTALCGAVAGVPKAKPQADQ